MNKYIKEELGKCKLAKVPEFDDSTTHMVVPKSKTGVASFLRKFELNHMYLIKVADYILHPFEGFTLHSVWNHNIIPTDAEMLVDVIDVRGSLYKVEAVGKNDGKHWSGWLPLKSIEIIGEVDNG